MFMSESLFLHKNMEHSDLSICAISRHVSHMTYILHLPINNPIIPFNPFLPFSLNQRMRFKGAEEKNAKGEVGNSQKTWSGKGKVFF